MGISPAFALACRKQGVEPGRQYDLSSLRSLTVAGSPLPVDGFEWIYEQVDASVLLINGSGGTDMCSGIVQGCPLLPVYAGEIAGRCLGVDVAAFDEHGEEVVGELGELVIRQPMPSMAVRFWNDPGDARYRAAYFDHYPGIWRHGDWIMFSERGSSVITGRSDATLNRGGVRLGTSEFYSALEELDEVVDGLVVHLEDADELILFVVLRDGLELDDAMRKRIASALRDALSPRHVPDTIVALPVIPHTLTGKKLELPVKLILTGVPSAEVVSTDALASPSSMEPVLAYASTPGPEPAPDAHRPGWITPRLALSMRESSPRWSASATLNRWRRIASSARSGARATTASTIAACSACEAAGRPGMRIVRYWYRTIWALRPRIRCCAVL